MIKRFPDWPERLNLFVESRQSQRARWGVQDCALFACDAVIEMTGVDLAADFRGAYESAKTAREQLRMYVGGSTLRDATEWIATEHGISRVPPAFAQRGDVALISMDNSWFKGALALVMIGHVLVPAKPRGLERVPLSRITQVWAVGREV